MAKNKKETKKQAEVIVTKLNNFEELSAFLDEAKAKKKKTSSTHSSWMDYDDGYGMYGYMGGA